MDMESLTKAEMIVNLADKVLEGAELQQRLALIVKELHAVVENLTSIVRLQNERLDLLLDRIQELENAPAEYVPPHIYGISQIK